METFSALPALCAGNSPVTGEFPSQRPVTRRFHVFFMFAWINSWVNNRETGDLRRHRAHYDVIVIQNGPYRGKAYSLLHPLGLWSKSNLLNAHLGKRITNVSPHVLKKKQQRFITGLIHGPYKWARWTICCHFSQLYWRMVLPACRKAVAFTTKITNLKVELSSSWDRNISGQISHYHVDAIDLCIARSSTIGPLVLCIARSSTTLVKAMLNKWFQIPMPALYWKGKHIWCFFK